jgi:fumarate reductase subunit D
METAVLIVAGWTAGINAYLTVLLLGLAGRLGWIDAPPQVERPLVLAVCGVAFMLELVADKLPLFDSAWDLVHTLIRPGVAAAVGAAAATVPGATLDRPTAALLTGGLALVAHLSKASTRLAINVSPEPLTNLAASLTEDAVVTGLLALALARPGLAAVVALVLMVMFAIVGIALFSLARRGLRSLRRQVGRSRVGHYS